VNQNQGYLPVPTARHASGLGAVLLTQSFFWMFAALLLTAFTALLVENNSGMIAGASRMWIFLMLGEFGLAIGIQRGIRRLNAMAALALFFVYAALNGVTFGVIVMVYSASYGGATVAQAFLSAAAMFAGAGFYGLVTKRSLVGTYGIMAMATWGLLIAIVLNTLLGNSLLDLAISAAGVVIYAVLTASTTQKIMRGGFLFFTGSIEKAAVLGALLLYIEFVAMFMFMLRLMSGRR
jgi:uncharacterized protein